MTTDPWLLVAQRHFEDMRQVAVRDRLVKTDRRRFPGVARLAAIVAGAVGAIHRPTEDAIPAEVPTEYEHRFLAPDGTVSLVDANDRATAADVLGDAKRLVHLHPVR